MCWRNGVNLWHSLSVCEMLQMGFWRWMMRTLMMTARFQTSTNAKSVCCLFQKSPNFSVTWGSMSKMTSLTDVTSAPKHLMLNSTWHFINVHTMRKILFVPCATRSSPEWPVSKHILCSTRRKRTSFALSVGMSSHCTASWPFTWRNTGRSWPTPERTPARPVRRSSRHRQSWRSTWRLTVKLGRQVQDLIIGTLTEAASRTHAHTAERRSRSPAS